MQDKILNPTKIILPKWIWTQAEDKAHFKQLVSEYLMRYPGYTVREIGKYYAICEIPFR
ncbi:hypothetical protein J2Z83_003772 [Virgibacillus natechei]|uniref:Uncharacterized protein n=1 Tax=Virgibacillus natechei TaxID=1216297 RepID=A0ABS4IMH0_9BACI|nr:hypothetical protein [Virgibacillus natechei]